MIVAGIVRARGRMVRNHFFPPARGSHRRRPRWSLLALLVGTLAFASFLLGTMALLFIQLQSLGFGLAEAGGALSLVFAAAVGGLLIFDLHYAVSALLLDSDLALLRLAPLTPRQILTIKLADALPRTFVLLAVLVVPAAIGFALSHPLPLWGWALLPVQVAGLWSAPLGLGVCAALLLVRAVPARRAREILALVSTFVLIGLWLVNAFVLPRFAADDAGLVSGLAAALTTPAWMLWASPPHWGGFALAAAAGNDLPRALGWTLALAAVGALSLTLAGRVAGAVLDDTLARLTVDPSLQRRDVLGPPSRPAAGGLVALLLKDARLFARDWTVMGDVITGALLWTLLPLVARPLVEAPTEILVRAMFVALTVGLGYEVGARAVPFERGGLAWARLAPVKARRWNTAKLLAGMALSLPLVAVAAVVIRFALPTDLLAFAESFVLALSSLTLALASGLWTGWAFGDPRWTNPRAMLTMGGRITAAVLLLVQAAGWLGLLAVLDTVREHLPPGAHLWIPPLLAGAATAFCLAGANAKLRRFEWSG